MITVITLGQCRVYQFKARRIIHSSSIRDELHAAEVVKVVRLINPIIKTMVATGLESGGN